MLRPRAGRAGTYDVTLFGRSDGDLVTTFRWTTPVGRRAAHTAGADSPCSPGDDGEVDSYGVELQ